MAASSYARPDLIIGRGLAGATQQQIRDLQRDLRALGYLRSGIDGVFAEQTEQAVRALRIDLLSNDGTSTAGDGSAPVRVQDYNHDRVADVTGTVDLRLAACIADMLADLSFPKLPSSQDPLAANRAVLSLLTQRPPGGVPLPFLLAILEQESGLKHFSEPQQGDDDNYVVVGCDRNDDAQPDRITSRGYGIGQYTLFHHPPQQDEVRDFVTDPTGNVQRAVRELRAKFDQLVLGGTPGTQADDRIHELGNAPLRECKYDAADPRRFNDCRNCAAAAGTADLVPGVTPWYVGTADVYRLSQYYSDPALFNQVPIRKNIGCDWPYAARRYNGSGNNSYCYQIAILKHLTH